MAKAKSQKRKEIIMSNEILGQEVTFTDRYPIYGSTSCFERYQQESPKAIVSFEAIFTENALKKIHERSGATVPLDLSDVETYVFIFCDKTKKNIRQRRVDIYTYFGDDEETRMTLTPDEAESVVSRYNNPKYGKGNALEYVKSEEKIHGDKIKKYAKGVEYAGDFAADMAAIAATGPRFKNGSGVDR